MSLPDRPEALPEGVYHKLSNHSAPEELTVKFLDRCKALGNVDEVRAEFEAFRSDKRFVGPKIELLANEQLGNVRSFRQVAGRLQKLTGQDIDAIEGHLHHLSGEGTLRQQEDARTWFETEIVPESANAAYGISATPSWLFRQAVAGEDIYKSPECLPWRLGLPWLADATIMCIGLRFDATETELIAHRPTAFDCDFSWLAGLWEPLGETKPLELSPDMCKSGGGLREIVTAPPTFGQVKLPTVVFQSAE